MFLSRFSIYIFAQYKYSLFEHMRTILKTNTFERMIDLARYYIYICIHVYIVRGIFYGYKNGGKKIGRGGRRVVGAE